MPLTTQRERSIKVNLALFSLSLIFKAMSISINTIYNGGKKISNNVKKLNLKGQDKETFIYFCLLFDCNCQSLASGKKMLYSTGIWQFPKNSWFLKILILNCSATSQATLRNIFGAISSIALLLANQTYIKMLQDFIIS